MTSSALFKHRHTRIIFRRHVLFLGFVLVFLPCLFALFFMHARHTMLMPWFDLFGAEVAFGNSVQVPRRPVTITRHAISTS